MAGKAEQGYIKKSHRQDTWQVLAERAVGTVKEAAVGGGWTPVISLARSTCLSLMSHITRGHLAIIDDTLSAGSNKGKVHTFGQPRHTVPVEEQAEIRVIKDSFWLRLVFLSDLGFAEAYMFGEIEVENLVGVFKMFVYNRDNLTKLSTKASTVFQLISKLTNSRFVNSISNSISNISAHYDISNQMFEAFLDKSMTYSCAVWETGTGEGWEGREPALELLQSHSKANGKPLGMGTLHASGKDDKVYINGDGAAHDELEIAQIRKLRLIISRCRIGPGDKVLEIGSGWGSFAIEAVRHTGCHVDTITLSIEQKELAEQRIEAAGFSDKIKVHLLDYRNLPTEWFYKFDRVVSIEMLEAVGNEYLATYFAVIDKCLKLDRGIGVFQVITLPEERYSRYCNEVDFIRKWIFPGGHVPSITALTNSVYEGTAGRLVIDSIQNIGPHYSRTLREWRDRFLENFDSRIRPTLLETYPEMRENEESIAIFRRKWEYYFDYCRGGFATRSLGDHVITLTRECNYELHADVPE